MRRDKSAKAPGSFSSLLSRALDLLGIAGLLAAEARQALGQKAESALWRAVLLIHLTLWVSAGLFLMLLGCLQWLIDQAGLPRGPVHAIAGLLVCLVAALIFQSRRRRAH